MMLFVSLSMFKATLVVHTQQFEPLPAQCNGRDQVMQQTPVICSPSPLGHYSEPAQQTLTWQAS